MTNRDNVSSQVAEHLDEHLRTYPHLAERIYRELLMALHRRGIASIDSIHDQARTRTGQPEQGAQRDPNQTERERWDEQERAHVEQITREYACLYLSVADVDDLVNLTLKRETVHSLELVADLGNVTFKELADNVHRFCQIPPGETRLAPAEVVGTRVALIRHFISDQLEFIGVAKNYLHIRDFDDLTRRMLGNEESIGRIGGKAAGMLLAHKILMAAGNDCGDFAPLAVPESYYLRSDAVEDFIRLNRLDEYRSQKYKPIDDVAREYPLIRGVFRHGDFPLKIIHGLRSILGELGNHPLIVRSSSLLEDRIGTAFCGKYASFFLANQGTLEERLRVLLGAIAEVYASVMAPDPILYRREHNLIDYVEEMAVLIQKVVGFRVGDYFLPAFAGVAFSRNEYRWAPRIEREDGLVRMVMGLGTRAVDRGGSDYPRMVALGAPTIRPESTVQEIVARAQRAVDVVDFKANRLRSIRLSDLLNLRTDFPIPMLDKIVSIYQDDELSSPPGVRVDADPANLCVTFDKLVRDTPFARCMRNMLTRLEEAYGAPVDVEFACDGRRLYILQCRTLAQTPESGPVAIPRNIPPESVVFDAHKYVRTGLIEGIEYIVYVDPLTYDAIPTRETRIALARVIGHINHALKPRSFILVGPGRWGSNDVRLGVPVKYADINNCRMLVEVAKLRGGFMPEVSFGTHFFQDLVEAGIHYLPLYPDEEGNRFNHHFLGKSANSLVRVVPDDAELADYVRVVHVPSVANGRTLAAVMDGDADYAVAFLK
ncbi:MAG: PEP/pyruvate-binding domain-containing protein [Phycisphaerae bacterium]